MVWYLLILFRIIDWDTVSVVPSPAAIQHPLFMADIPGFRHDNVPQSMNFADDRSYLVNAIRVQFPESANMANLLASSCERQFFELSLRNKRINREYIRCRPEEPEISMSTASRELREFISAHARLEDHPAVIDLWRRLSETNEDFESIKRTKFK
jgi:hypothetical protein